MIVVEPRKVRWRIRSYSKLPGWHVTFANDGRAAIARPITVGCATASLAARLATLPNTSSAHGSTPPGRPDLDSAGNVVDAATIIPSTDSCVSAAHPGYPCSATSMCMWR